MNNIIQCQVKQIEPVNNYGKIKVHLLPLEENESIKSSNGFKQDSNTFSINWKEQEAIPDWLVEGNQIKMPFKIYMDYAIYDQFSKIGVQVLGESNPIADIKKAFPDATLEQLPDSLDEEETDFNFGANKKKLNGHSTLSEEKRDFAAQYLSDYEAIGKIGKPDFSLAKLDQSNFKDVITSCKISMTQKFGN